MDALNRYAPQMRSVLRIVAALIFLAHGTQKILGFPASEMNPPAFSIFWTAGIIELITGTLLVLGLFTRPAAFVASGMMAVAYWMVHAPQSPFPALNGAMRPSSTASCSCIWPSPGRDRGAWTPRWARTAKKRRA